jgi:hypothetical protein
MEYQESEPSWILLNWVNTTRLPVMFNTDCGDSNPAQDSLTVVYASSLHFLVSLT